MKQAPIKTDELCDSCAYGWEFTCKVNESCRTCPMFLKVSKPRNCKHRKREVTICKCNSVFNGHRCYNYKPIGGN